MRLETETTVFKKDSVKDAIKNKVIHQGTEPSGSFSVGDTWFDSANGYKMYVWDGTQWAPEELDSPAIKTGAIKASHIDAGAVTADKIAANSISVSKLSVGMDNLATVNEWDDDSMATAPSGYHTTTAVINSTTGLKAIVKANDNGVADATTTRMALSKYGVPSIFVTGDEIYYSFRARAINTARNVTLRIGGWDKDHTWLGSISKTIALTTSFQKFTGTITLENQSTWAWSNNSDNLPILASYFIYINDNNGSGDQLRIMQIEIRKKNSGDLIVGGQIEGASFKTALGKGYTVDDQEGTITVTENSASEIYAFLDHAGLKYLTSGGTERATLYPMKFRELDSGGSVVSTQYGWMTPQLFFAPKIMVQDGSGGGGEVVDIRYVTRIQMATNLALSKLNEANTASHKLSLNPINITNANLTNGSNWDTLGNSWYYKSGTRVHLHIAVTGLTADTTTTVFTMPSGYRPYNYVIAAGRGNTGSVFASMWVNSSGTVSVRTTSTNAAVDIEYDAFN